MESTSPRPRFSSSSPFHTSLKQRVDEHFQRTGGSRSGGSAHALKAGVMLGWLAASYAVAMFGGVPGWLAALLAISMGLAAAGVGFCVMHDANHGSLSSSARWNRLLGLSADLVGVSSFVWRQKHNVIHHTYTNVSGFDDDLETGGVLRLAPWQPRHPLHRFQHLYVWVLYALFPLRWWLIDDVHNLVRGKVGTQKIARPSLGAWAELVAGKLLFLSWAFVLPALIHRTWWLVPLWLLGIATVGIMLAAVFQLAHCVGEAEFVSGSSDSKVHGSDWAEHQVRTTVNFAPSNRWVSWYVGGLNFQVEHHLFPRISHVHYPALSRVVEQTCREFGIPYRATPTVGAALLSNVRWIRKMGRREEPVLTRRKRPAIGRALDRVRPAMRRGYEGALDEHTR